MANWAVVVGLNVYTLPNATLHGAVRDALRMCCWLLDPAGGAVPRQQLFLGLNPVAPLPALGDPCDALLGALQPTPCPDKDSIVGLFHTLVRKSGGDGDRLYVYFAGHGLQYQSGQNLESAVVASDVDPLFPDRSLSVTSILEYFEATSFLDQFFFFDACRNVPWKGKFRAGQVSVGPPCDPPAAAPQQFVCLATSEGTVAIESPEGGAFTDALLRGLSGQDDAKMFDPEGDRFVVSWNRLFTFVCTEVQKAQRTLAGKAYVQVPRDEKSKRGATRSTDPELWSVKSDAANFPKVDLSVLIDPPVIAPSCTITVRSLYDLDQSQRFDPPTPVPRTIPLSPSWYRVFSSAPGFRHDQPRGLAVPLMAAREVSLKMAPIPPVPPLSSPGSGTRGLGMPELSVDVGGARSLDGLAGPQKEKDTGPATLMVNPRDALMSWELVWPSGRTETHTGTASLSLPAGVYTVRTTTPEGVQSETVMDLAAGKKADAALALPAPSPALEQLARQASFEFEDDRQRMVVSEAFGGGIANVELSTVLALAATVVVTNDQGLGYKLRKVNLAPVDAILPAARPGLVVVFGAEPRERGPAVPTPVQELSAVRVGWWQPGERPAVADRPLELRGDAPAIAQWITPSEPGHGRLVIAAPGRELLFFNLFVPHDRVLVVIVHRFTNADVGVYLHTVSRGENVGRALHRVRLLDLAQRYMLRGRFDYPSDPGDLLEGGPDPVAMLLAAYAFQRKGDHETAFTLASNLHADYPGWSDPHLVRAEALARRNSDLARAEYAAALEAGAPIFAGGLARLWQAITRLKIRHPQRERLEALVRDRLTGVLWTAARMPPH